MPSVILAKSFGDHSNRLFQAIHFEAFCLDRGFRFVNTVFDDMAPYYPLAKTSRRTKAAGRIVRLLVNAKLAEIRTDLKSASDLARISSGRVALVGGWGFRVRDLTKRYQDYFIMKYSIDKHLLVGNSVAKRMAEWRSSGLVVVGVHIRRGDYKSYEQGRYYYSDSVYESAMLSLQRGFAARGRGVRFVLFSNEFCSLDVGDERSSVFSGNDWAVDHALMSQCDFLVGPPSSFTKWASYIGKTPFLPILEPYAEIKFSDFHYCSG